MSQYTAIPLCTIKYTGDSLGGATFKYNTLFSLNRGEYKLLSNENISSLNKDNDKLIYKDISSINKTDSMMLYRDISNMIKLYSKEMYKAISSIQFIHDMYLCRNDLAIIKNQEFELSSEDTFMHIEHDKPLSPKQTNILIETSKPLSSSLKLILCEMSIELINPSPININQIIAKDLSPEIINDLWKTKEQSLESNYLDIMTYNVYQNLESLHSSGIVRNNCLEIQATNLTEISTITANNYDNITQRLIGRTYESFYTQKVNDRINIDKSLNPNYLYRINIVDALKEDYDSYLNRISIKELDKDYSKKLFYSQQNIPLSKYEYMSDFLMRVNTKIVDKDNSKKLYYRQVLNKIFPINYNRGLIPIAIVNILKDHSQEGLIDIKLVNINKKIPISYLSREVLVNVFKESSRSLYYSPLINIYSELSMALSREYSTNIYRDNQRLMRGTDLSIYKEINTSSIEITKRWWWLNSTSPTDNLIVPNKDYADMVSLLSNSNYEYLRYENHPIDWGSVWGKDWNIPPMAVSVEIMLDLVNIIIMVWHSNVQGWLCCSGKEGVQFLMELIYDWYSMNTSSPNSDYKRAYRWIRWEAEKVYFLEAKTGLQAIGMLVGNLLDYLKLHHFNNVPLWRNPKAMDIERNFNKIATNGDLISDVDKNKGIRHYQIETQNFEKKNIF